MKLKTLNEGKGFIVIYTFPKGSNKRLPKPAQAAYNSKPDAEKFLKDVESDGGRGMIIQRDVKGLKTESVEEPQIIKDLRWIVDNKQNKKIKDPVSGKTIRVDLFSASAVIQVYDAINDNNKKKYVTASLPKMVSMAFKLLK